MDPEAGMNIVDLGLVYGIDASAQGVRVLLTMTSAACPMTELIVDDAHEQLAAMLPVDMPVEVELVWDPPWTPERMSAVARAMFGWQPGQWACRVVRLRGGRRWSGCRCCFSASSP
jgi:metal-sulfur cluster biosynthetic enzyme